MPRGLLIVIDGPDGSGKGTQTKLLIERLKKEGRNVERIAFPRYGQPSAHFVEQYLNGKYGSAKDVGAKRASILYALDRFAASFEVRTLLENGTTIISDRYVSANKGHQMAQISDPEERKAFLHWLNDLEYNILDIPKPDLTILLHVPADIGFDLIAQKDDRGYLDGKKRDILESDRDHLRAAEQTYLELPHIDEAEQWHTLSCVEQGELLPIQTIQDRLYALVTATLAG
jgi:dTMP kinase